MNSDWQSIQNDREKYQAYLCSREWCEKREAVRQRCGDTCERCRINPMDSCHHLTYARKYREWLEDLQGICNACHAYIHGKSDFDPAKTGRQSKQSPQQEILERTSVLDDEQPEFDEYASGWVSLLEAYRSAADLIPGTLSRIKARSARIALWDEGENVHVILPAGFGFETGDTTCHMLEREIGLLLKRTITITAKHVTSKMPKVIGQKPGESPA